MSYPEPQGPRDCVAAWAFVGAVFLALVVASFVVELVQKPPQLLTNAPSLNALERKAAPNKRRADSCCTPHDEPRPTAR